MKVKSRTTCKLNLNRHQVDILNRCIEHFDKDEFDEEEIWFLNKLRETMCDNEVQIKVSYLNKEFTYEDNYNW